MTSPEQQVSEDCIIVACINCISGIFAGSDDGSKPKLGWANGNPAVRRDYGLEHLLAG